jgi:hypothetical protein
MMTAGKKSLGVIQEQVPEILNDTIITLATCKRTWKMNLSMCGYETSNRVMCCCIKILWLK